MSLKTPKEAMTKNIPLFSLLDMQHIDNDKSFISPNGDDYINNKVYFRIIEDDDFIRLHGLIFDTIAKDNGIKMPLSDDEYYVVYDFLNRIEHSEGEIIGFAIRRNGMIYFDCGELIGSTRLYMNYYKYPSEGVINRRFDAFCQQCSEWIKCKIRNVLMVGIKGEFCTDKIETDTYFQRRTAEQDMFYDYIIHDWNRKMNDEEPISWVDFMDEGKIYISLN